MSWSLPKSSRANQVSSQENLTDSKTAKPKPNSSPAPAKPAPAKPKPNPEDKKDNISDNIFNKWWFYVAVIVAILIIAAGIYALYPSGARPEPLPNVNNNYIQ